MNTENGFRNSMRGTEWERAQISLGIFITIPLSKFG
jgi:hypothetical protein